MAMLLECNGHSTGSAIPTRRADTSAEDDGALLFKVCGLRFAVTPNRCFSQKGGL